MLSQPQTIKNYSQVFIERVFAWKGFYDWISSDTNDVEHPNEFRIAAPQCHTLPDGLQCFGLFSCNQENFAEIEIMNRIFGFALNCRAAEFKSTGKQAPFFGDTKAKSRVPQRIVLDSQPSFQTGQSRQNIPLIKLLLRLFEVCLSLIF